MKLLHVTLVLFMFKYASTCQVDYTDLENCVTYITCVNYFDASYRKYCDGIQLNSNYYNDPKYTYIDLTLRLITNVSTHIYVPDGNEEKLNQILITVTSLKINILRTLDIEFPILRKMTNLASLTISETHIKIAKVSNTFELESLTKVNFSHNEIENIQKNDNEIAFKKLRTMDLSYNMISYIPPAVFEDLTELEFLNLSNNYIESLHSMAFEGIKNLVHLNISNNRITDINASLFRFTKLTELNMNNNFVDHIRDNDFQELINLKYLYIKSNLLTKLDNGNIDKMKFLMKLDLSNNQILYIEQNVFKNMSVVCLDLSNNKLKSLPKDLLKGNHVSEFSVKGNIFEGALFKGEFEGIDLVSELDLSSQNINGIEDYAFFGLENLEIIKLNNNSIDSIAKYSFKSLHSLRELDLSFNKIKFFTFVSDSYKLRVLSLRNNYLTQINPENFQGMEFLLYLDISKNNITHLDANVFEMFNELIDLQMSGNPIEGSLEKNAFKGLNALPRLDISHTSLLNIQNESFYGMNTLREINISHSELIEIQFNAFSKTGYIESLDLSFNKLKVFLVNATELANICYLYLNNNLLKQITSTSLGDLLRLSKLMLYNNKLTNLDSDVFHSLIDMRYLDLSENSELSFNDTVIKSNQNLFSMNVSGIKNIVPFTPYTYMDLAFLKISHVGIENITMLNLFVYDNLENLVLSFNNITRLEVGCFRNMTRMRSLDISYNRISYIQPGTFKDNTFLYLLNVSHNYLTAITYGSLRGLISLSTLDISFNNITSLQTERFYEVNSLNFLIADSNRISYIDIDQFRDIPLSALSIGDNPLPCESIVNIKKSGTPFDITAIRKDEHSNENIDGIACNMNGVKENHKILDSAVYSNDSNTIMFDIKDLLSKILNKNVDYNITVASMKSDPVLITNFTQQVAALYQNSTNYLSKLAYLTTTVVKNSNNTNIILENILKYLNKTNPVKDTSKYNVPIPVPKANASLEDVIIPYINKLRNDLEDKNVFAKQSMLDEIEEKIEHKFKIYLMKSTTVAPLNEKYQKSLERQDSKSLFTEICVGVILTIVIGLVLYKFYKSGRFVPRSRSMSSRQIADSMESSNL